MPSETIRRMQLDRLADSPRHDEIMAGIERPYLDLPGLVPRMRTYLNWKAPRNVFDIRTTVGSWELVHIVVRPDADVVRVITSDRAVLGLALEEALPLIRLVAVPGGSRLDMGVGGRPMHASQGATYPDPHRAPSCRMAPGFVHVCRLAEFRALWARVDLDRLTRDARGFGGRRPHGWPELTLGMDPDGAAQAA